MPRLRESTLEAHRTAVRAAILDATSALVARAGLRAVTMSQVAEDAGIGRATLYRYFADVDALLLAWHEGRIGRHLHQLEVLRHGEGSAFDRLVAVLSTYAALRHQAGGPGDAALLHGGAYVQRAHRHVAEIVGDLVADAVSDGAVRSDVPPADLAAYCLAALEAAGRPGPDAVVQGLVGVVLDGLRPAVTGGRTR